MQNNIFTSEKLEKIRNAKLKNLLEMAIELLKYYNHWKQKIEKLFEDDPLILKCKDFDKIKHFNYDWIKNSSLVDRSFNELEELDICKSELCCIALSKRKNKNRIIQELIETRAEKPKDAQGYARRFGQFCQMGHRKSTLIRIDAPAGYICRVMRTDTLQIPTDVNCFNQALKCMSLAWKAKVSINISIITTFFETLMIIHRTIDVVERTNDNNNALEDLQNASVCKLKDKNDGIPGLIDDVYGRISYMSRQKRRSKVELHDYIVNIINDYERWIKCLKNLNEFDSAVKEQELKEAFVTEKNKYDEKIKELEEENIFLKNNLALIKIDEMEIEFEKLEEVNWLLSQKVENMSQKEYAGPNSTFVKLVVLEILAEIVNYLSPRDISNFLLVNRTVSSSLL
ncbi:hypothetical protein C2G38_2224821 [Gigaspora rosea]|uniref:F-box domain-containing protein n=1 Tax=Gigaspora rosea TaxID=44941 RepID=A0A397TZU1_9GLOM|nr:hypothetical protein C2G38_2224821 [Gigaspora rosea]